MLSLKRALGIFLAVAFLGAGFLIYSIYESRLAGVQFKPCLAPVRKFTETRQVDEGEKPKVLILGNSKDEGCGEIYSNVRQFCQDICLMVSEKEYAGEILEGQDLVIFCDSSISRYAEPEEIERFVAKGGRVIFAAGIGEDERDFHLWQVLGIRQKYARKDYHDLVFEKPLLPVQPEEAYYDGNSSSAEIKVSDDACVYIWNEENDIPIFYTNDWGKGNICLINGTFLADIRYTGLLTGAISALFPDFVYPVLGVKAVFLDNFPMVTSAGDELCRDVYGYSQAGFIQDVVWPAFQGISLRMDIPYTVGLLVAASSQESFTAVDDELITTISRLVLQFNGELVCAANCPETGKVAFNEDFMKQLSAILPNYKVQGLVMENGNFSPELLNVPGTDIRSVRGELDSRDMRFSWEDRWVFPAATEGNSMEDGNLFAVCSVLGAYGMVSHVFDVNKMIVGDGNKDTAAWDADKKQMGLFESEVLDHVPWLEGRTLTQTEGDVRSYLEMDYGWSRNGNRLELECSGVAKGQAFFYHTDSPIVYGEGLTYQDVGNGYYLLRIQENHGMLSLKEE